jgi:hypothetical protein
MAQEKFTSIGMFGLIAALATPCCIYIQLLLLPVETGKWKLEDSFCQHYPSSKEREDCERFLWDA